MIFIMKVLNFLFQKTIIVRLNKKKNSICINVFCYENDLIYPIYVSDQKIENCVDLLLITNENKSHYVYIQNVRLKLKSTFARIVLVVREF